MSLLTNLIEGMVSRLGYEKPKAEPQKEVTPSQISIPSYPAIGSDPKASEFINSYRGWIYANVKRVAEQLTNIDYKLMQQKADEAEPVEGHPADELLMKVNDQMTQRQLMEITWTHMMLAGEAFWAVNRGPTGMGEPKSIIPLRPDEMIVIPAKEESGRLIEGYVYRRHNRDGGFEEVPLSADEVIFFKEPDPMNPFRGLGIIKASALTIDTDYAQEQFNYEFFKQGGSMNPAFETDQVMSADELRRNYEMLRQNFTGVPNAHKMMILHSGLKMAKTGFSQREMEFLKGQEWTRDKIMSMTGTTKTLLGITDDVNRSNAEVAEVVFNKYTILPKAEKMAEYLNEYYVPMFKRTENLFYMVDDPTPPNAEEQIVKYKAALGGASWMTQNEVRAKEGLEPVEGGDTLYAPANVVPAGTMPQQVTPEEGKGRPTARQKLIKARQKRGELREEIVKNELTEGMKPFARKLLSKDAEEAKSFRERAEAKGGFHDQFKQHAISFEQNFRKEIQGYFKNQEEDVIRRIEHMYVPKSVDKKLSDFLPDLKEFKEVGIAIVAPLIEDIAEKRGNEALFFIGSNIGFDLDIPRARDFIDKKAGQLIKDIDGTTRDALKRELSEGIKEGEGIPEMKRRVRSVFDTAQDSRAEMIARTETIKAANFATEEAYRQSDVVVAKEWITALDERVCPGCSEMDGKIIPLGDNYFEKGDALNVRSGGDLFTFSFRESTGYPPLHPSCRCTLIPVMGEIKAVSSVKREKPIISEKELKKLEERIDALNDLD